MSDDDLVAVFCTADSALLPLIRTVLDAAEIPYLVQGEEALGLLPLGPFSVGVNRSSLGAIVRVPAERADEARELIESGARVDEGDAP